MEAAAGRSSRVPAARARGRRGIRALRLDLLGHLAEGDLAQRGQVLDAEEVVERGLDALLRIDLAGLQARYQRLRREVDEHDLVGDRDHGVGDRLAHARPGQLGDAVVEALEVLDIDGREDVDPGRQHVGDVLVALGVLDAGGVGVRELVDQRQLGRPSAQCRQVHLLELGVAVGDAAARDDLEPRQQRGRLGPPVRLGEPDHDVAAGLRLGLALLLLEARAHAVLDHIAQLDHPEDLGVARDGERGRPLPRQPVDRRV